MPSCLLEPESRRILARGYVLKVRRIVPFQMFAGPGYRMLPTIVSYDRIVLNMGTAASYEFSPEDLYILRGALAPGDDHDQLESDA